VTPEKISQFVDTAQAMARERATLLVNHLYAYAPQTVKDAVIDDICRTIYQALQKTAARAMRKNDG
jgi:hypothetical protein